MTEAAAIQERWNRRALADAWAELGSLAELEPAVADDADGAWRVDGAYPAFQFESGRRDVVRQVVDILAPVLAPRSILLWFTTSSGRLDGARPVDVIDVLPTEVVAAARYQASLGCD